MTRKQTVGITALFFAAIMVYVLCLNFLSKPQFALDARDRIESYLSYSYGPLNCLSAKDKGREWQISCNTDDGEHSFVYAVHDAKERPYGFLLTALSDDARGSYNVDLVSYLDIKTVNN